MATQSEIINAVRRRVSDYKTTRVYSDEYYIDAVERALSKLSYDFSASYIVATDVPTSRVFLLQKLATIEMCYVRAANFVDEDGDGSAGDIPIHTLKVPDLEIEGSSSSRESTAAAWISLAEKLQSEYDGELSHAGGSSNAAEIQTGVLKRISLRTGGYRKYALDEGLAAVTVSAVVDGSTVALSWSVLYDETFLAYEVYRGELLDMSDEERIAYISDNQEHTYSDEDVAVGAYYYRVKTVNPNSIKTDGNTLAITVT